MSFLTKIKKGSVDLPPRVILAGPEGIGKSTYGANAPSPLFISAEDGLTGLEHVDRFTPDSYKDLLAFMTEIENAASFAFGTIVIDTADWLERLIQAHICKRDKKANIEEYGYGKGYNLVEPELVAFLQMLDRIRHKHKVGIVILSHVKIKLHSPPGAEPYDRFEMKGHKGFTGILREWPDACLFTVYETFNTKEEGVKKTIGGDRVIHTSWAPGWDAKNRYNLPATIALERERGHSAVLDLIEQHRNKPHAEPSPEELRDKIATLIPLVGKLDEDAQAKLNAFIQNLEKHDTKTLKAGLNRLEELVDNAA